MKTTLSLIFGSLVMVGTASAEPIKHAITGLFAKDREGDLREAMEKIPQIKLVKIDFAAAEATFDYVPAKVFPGAKPDQILQRFDDLLRQNSNHTLGIKKLSTVASDKLVFVEIPAGGLDCKACCLAAYEAIYKLDGVERATASFKEGLVTAHIDPTKTDRAKLEDALKKRGVEIKKR